MSQKIISLKNIKCIRTYIFLIFSIINLIKSNSQNTIKLDSLNNFIDDFTGIEVCGDKFLTRTESGEVLLSSDLGYNWSKLSLGKINKVISFENTEINKAREKFTRGNKFNYEFLKNLLVKKSKNEDFTSEIKLSNPQENTVFITNEGEIFFSKNCGFDFLNENLGKNGFNELHAGLGKKVIVKDFVFHPDN